VERLFSTILRNARFQSACRLSPRAQPLIRPRLADGDAGGRASGHPEPR